MLVADFLRRQLPVAIGVKLGEQPRGVGFGCPRRAWHSHG
jgi:hypothetical protein